MLVFYKERLAFLAVPKTGTTAYHSALKDHADVVISGPPELKHMPVYRYNRFMRPMFERACQAELELMAVMREPISWLGSWYRYRRRPEMKGHANSTHKVSFDDFIQAYASGAADGFANVGSQAQFLAPRPNGTAITHYFTYEDQPRLKAFLEDRLGLQFTLARENTSPNMPLHLSEKVEEHLRESCPDEFTLYESICAHRRKPEP
ncbi:MAG: gamma-glutamyl kinase [Pseudomonadota bacterium]